MKITFFSIPEVSSPAIHTKETFETYAKCMMDIHIKIRDLVDSNIKKAQSRQKKNFDKRHMVPTFEIGKKVLLKNESQG